MPEVLRTFEELVVGDDGLPYRARACGRERPDGEWEGWIEFVPTGGGTTLRTGRETTQASWGDLAYWASGLTAVYLEGALARTLEPMRSAPPAPPAEPTYDRPAPPNTPVDPSAAILDPFSVREKGEELLSRELQALEAWHLRNIVRAYRLADERRFALEGLSRGELVELIVRETRRLLPARQAGIGRGHDSEPHGKPHGKPHRRRPKAG
jgi:hypothetical protein